MKKVIRTASVLLFAFVLGIFFNFNDVTYAGTLKTVALCSQVEDVNGDGIKENIILMGDVPKEDLKDLSMSTPDNLKLLIKDNKNSKILKEVKLDLTVSSDLGLVIVDFNGDNIKDIMVKGYGTGSAGGTSQNIYSFKDNKLDDLLSNKINTIKYDFKVGDSNTITISSNQLVGSNNLNYNFESNNEKSQLQSKGILSIDNIEPIDVDHDGVYELEYTNYLEAYIDQDEDLGSMKNEYAAIKTLYKNDGQNWIYKDMKVVDVDSDFKYSNNVITIKVNDKPLALDSIPTVINEKTMVPVRAIFEALNSKVQWDANTKTITATKDNTAIVLTIDSKTAIKNGENVELDVPATIINGRTMVPVRFIAESLGAKVEWDEKTKTVLIKSAI